MIAKCITIYAGKRDVGAYFICFTMVDFPLSPAPVNSKKTSSVFKVQTTNVDQPAVVVKRIAVKVCSAETRFRKLELTVIIGHAAAYGTERAQTVPIYLYH